MSRLALEPHTQPLHHQWTEDMGHQGAHFNLSPQFPHLSVEYQQRPSQHGSNGYHVQNAAQQMTKVSSYMISVTLLSP